MSLASISDWRYLPRIEEAEMIDNPTQPFPEIERSMRDVALSNRLFGGTQTVLFYVARLLRNVPKESEVRILDIATGSADIPLALAEWGRKEGRQLTIVGLDNHGAMVRMAQLAAPEIPLVQADALALPFAPKSFDIALCALAFHHFGYEMSIRGTTTIPSFLGHKDFMSRSTGHKRDPVEASPCRGESVRTD